LQCAARKEAAAASSVFAFLGPCLGYLLAACFFGRRDALLASCPKPVLMQINSRKLPGLTQAVRLRKGKFDLQKTSKIQIE